MNRYATPANFGSRIRNPLLREHYVYRAFSADGQLLYVGCTYNLPKRLKEHWSQSKEWSRVAYRMTASGPYNYETARQIEHEAIETERALHNYSSERRSIARAHSDVYAREFYLRLDGGASWEQAAEIAGHVAEAFVPYLGNLAPLQIKDGDVLAAKQGNARHRGFCVRAA